MPAKDTKLLIIRLLPNLGMERSKIKTGHQSNLESEKGFASDPSVSHFSTLSQQVMDITKFQAREKTTAINSPNTSGDDSVAETSGWDAKATKRLLWKLDLNIVPFMSLIYLYVPTERNAFKTNTTFTI